MTNDNAPSYRIAHDANAVVVLADVKLAYVNSDGTYGEPVPLPKVQTGFVKSPSTSWEIKTTPRMFQWEFETTARLINGKWIECRRSGKLFTPKMLHAMARRRDRAMARMGRST